MNNNYGTKITTGKVILNFSHLIKANNRGQFENSQANYDTTIIISKSDDETLSKIDNAIKNAIIESGFPNTAEIKSPLKDGDENYPYNSLYKNSMYMYVSSTMRPNVVDNKLQEIPFYSDEIASGSYARVSMYFEGYKSSKTGKFGISAKLLNVQVFPQNRYIELRSKPEEDFQVEDD